MATPLALYLIFILRVSSTAAFRNETDYELIVPDEQRLFQEIMEDYETAVRPASKHSGVVIVKFQLRLNQIIDLDERHQVLTTNVFIDQRWDDPSLAWNPARFNNVKSIRVPSTKLWLPDTFIYNNADGGSSGFLAGQYVLVSFDGEVLWPVPVKLRSACQVDVKYFPFDDQECILRFGSWIYNGAALRFVPSEKDIPIDMSEYVNNSEWDLLSVSLIKNKREGSCCVEPHTDLVYKLHIRRRTFFYVFNVIIPCIMLSVLTLLTFWVPATSGEKVTLGLSVFLAFSMFMLLIAEEVPASSESVPLIGIYLCCVMTMTSFSVIMAVLIINLYNRGRRTPRAPAWLRSFCLRFLSMLLRLTHDINAIAETITLDEEDDSLNKKRETPRNPKRRLTGGDISDTTHKALHKLEVHPRKYHRTSVSNQTGWLEYDNHGEHCRENVPDDYQPSEPYPQTSSDQDVQGMTRAVRHEVEHCHLQSPGQMTDTEASEADDTFDTQDTRGTAYFGEDAFHDTNDNPCKDEGQSLLTETTEEKTIEPTVKALFEKKVSIVEWQRIALVIDRLLFWLFFLGTLTAYLIILVIIPGNKKIPWNQEISTLHAIIHQT